MVCAHFLRLLGEGSTFLDSAIEVIYAVRLWIVYILIAGVAASLCIGSLYRHDEVGPSIFYLTNRIIGSVLCSNITNATTNLGM